MIGTRLGQYEIVEELGKGGMATVYRAYHPVTRRFVAIKVIHQAMVTDEAVLERFRQEAELIAQLEHPYLLPVYDYSVASDIPYIVMRYLEGSTLKDVIDANIRLPLGEIVFLMRQITSVVDYAHRKGVIHRDIKPSNIMIDHDGNAYLTDFGIARIIDQKGLTQTGFTVGTPGYMSPEQGLGLTNIDARTDIYALGVMVYEMATGEAPYHGETPMGVMMRHIQDPIPSATDVYPALPPDFDDVLEKALAKEPQDRYASAGEFAAALSKLVASHEAAEQPKKLQTIASEAIRSIQSKRDESKIQSLMNHFEGTRSSGMRSISRMAEQAALADKATELDSEPALKAKTRSRLPLVIGVVAILLLLFAAAAFIYSQNQQNINATATAEIIALSVANETATERARPTDTPIPSDTPSPTDTPEPTLPVAILQAQRELDVRVGPGANFPVIDTLVLDDELEVTGINEAGDWYQVLLPDGSRGWIPISRAFMTVSGAVDSIQVVAAPTLTPTDTVTPSLTPTASATNTPTATATPTATDTLTYTPLPTDTATATHTPLPTDTPIATHTLEATNTRRPSPTPAISPTPTPINCPGASPSRLYAGISGRVAPTGGGANRFREQPNLTSEVVGTIPEGGAFRVLEGPLCNAGYIWYRVDYRGSVGWTVEGVPDEYWLEPLG
jgi:serine/threonine protein kinase